MMSSILAWAIVLALGLAMCQDGAASIMFYVGKPGECWLFNHLIRLARVGAGLILMALAILMLIE